MFAYNWLKENPRERDTLVKSGWATLSKDAPYAVLAELKEMAHENVPLTDANLFWHGKQTEAMMVTGKAPFIARHIWTSKWLEYLYIITIEDPSVIHITTRYVSYLSQEPFLQELPITLDLVRESLHVVFRDSDDMLRWAVGHNIGDGWKAGRLSSSNIRQLIQNCELDFLKKIDIAQIDELLTLFRDCDVPTKKFRSLNEVQRAHDARTDAAVERMAKEADGYTYHYHPELLALVKQHGFTLPPDRMSLITRGARHHNCVATYQRQHEANVHENKSLLLFTSTATVELEIHRRHGLIIGTIMRQFKGAYNKNVTPTLELTSLQVALVGKSADLCDVRVALPDMEVV
jgi:hypothetical protein